MDESSYQEAFEDVLRQAPTEWAQDFALLKYLRKEKERAAESQRIARVMRWLPDYMQWGLRHE